MSKYRADIFIHKSGVQSYRLWEGRRILTRNVATPGVWLNTSIRWLKKEGESTKLIEADGKNVKVSHD